MPTKCEQCKKSIEPLLVMFEDLDNYKCPKCGSSIHSNTSGIHVHGRDM